MYAVPLCRVHGCGLRGARLPNECALVVPFMGDFLGSELLPNSGTHLVEGGAVLAVQFHIMEL